MFFNNFKRKIKTRHTAKKALLTPTPRAVLAKDQEEGYKDKDMAQDNEKDRGANRNKMETECFPGG